MPNMKNKRSKIYLLIFFLLFKIMVSQQNYDSLSNLNMPNGFFSAYKGSKVGLLNSKKKVVIPICFDDISPAEHQYFIVSTHNSLGLVSKDGKFILDTIYSSIWSDIGQFFIVEKGDEKGLFHFNGTWVLPLKPGILQVEEFIFSGCYILKQSGKCGIINKKGQFLVPVQYDNIKDFSESNLISESYALIQLGDKWGVINKKGKWILAPVFSRVEVQPDGRVVKAYCESGNVNVTLD